MELKQSFLVISILSALLIAGHARPSSEEDESEIHEDETSMEEHVGPEADEAGGGESGASGSGSGSGKEPTTTPPATGTPIPIGDAVNQACAGFQACIHQVDPAVCLKQMVTALSTLLPPVPVGGSPCPAGAGAPMPMPVPMPMPMPMPQPIPYPVQPSSCGGTYPCGDEESKSTSKKHHDKQKHKDD